MENEEYEKMKKKALKQLRSGESLFGKDGAFAIQPNLENCMIILRLY